MVNFVFIFSFFVIVLFDLVHNVDAIHDLYISDVHEIAVSRASLIFQKTRMMFIKHYAPNRCLCIKEAKSTMCN